MKNDKRAGGAQASSGAAASIPNRILGSLRDALNAASRDATGEVTVGERTDVLARSAAEAGIPPPPAATARPRQQP